MFFNYILFHYKPINALILLVGQQDDNQCA